MVIVFASIVTDLGFERQASETKDYNIGICCFSAMHAALRSKSKNGWFQNQENEYDRVYPQTVVSVRLAL